MNNGTRFTKKSLTQAIALASLPLLGIMAMPSYAQDQVILEEIVVTGSRRQESVQDLPLNISAVSGEMIEQQRLFGVAEIARYVPGLNVVDRGPRDEEPDIIVRGLNTTGLAESGFSSDTVGVYFGEIPVTFDIKPIDLERVEVLIGPQGTLYGKGTMGGAIRYLPNKADPSEFMAEFRGSTSTNIESDDLGFDYGVTLNLPLISDVLALRVNVDQLDDPGFIDYNYVVQESGVSNPQPEPLNPLDVAANLKQVKDANGEETLSARVNLQWFATDWLDFNFWYYYQDTEAEGRQISNQHSFGSGRYESGARYEEPNDFSNELLSVEISADLGFAAATLIYGELEYEEEGQRDQTDLLLNFEYGYEFFPSFSAFTRETEENEIETLELRFVSQHDGPFSWVAGYFEQEFTSVAVSREFTPGFDQFAVDEFGGLGLRPDSLEYISNDEVFEKESAFYGEISYDFADRLAVTLGYRHYEFEVNSASGFDLPLLNTVFFGDPQDAIDVTLGEPNKGKDKGNLFKVNLAYDVDDDNLLYFTYSEGYRNGGVNAISVCTAEQIASNQQQLCALESEVLVKPDQIENFEVGYKGFLFDNTVSLNAALYHINWEDLQVSTATVNGSLPIIGNGSEAVSRGLELQGRWLIDDNFEASFTYAYTNAELTERAPGLVGPFDALKGTRLPGHAEHQGSINLTYSTTVFSGVELDVNYGIVYTGDVFNIPGGAEDPLVDPNNNDAPADRGGEAIPSYDLHHLSATFRRDSWRVQAFVDNLWNTYYLTGTRNSRRFLQDELGGSANGNNIAGFTLRTYGQYIGSPRTLGVRGSYRF